MKRPATLDHKTAAAAIVCRQMFALVSGPVTGIMYCRAAQHDERNGYSITAAVEWRKAAEFMQALPTVADRCWQQWERIMHLPRSLAGPIPFSSDDVIPCNSARDIVSSHAPIRRERRRKRPRMQVARLKLRVSTRRLRSLLHA